MEERECGCNNTAGRQLNRDRQNKDKSCLKRKGKNGEDMYRDLKVIRGDITGSAVKYNDSEGEEKKERVGSKQIREDTRKCRI